MVTGDQLEDEDDFDSEIERLRARRAAAEDALYDAFDESPAVLVTEGGRQELWILSPETRPDEGVVRVSFLGPDGPHGHHSDEDVDALVRELANTWATYEPVDDAFVVRWTQTPEWERGLLSIAYVQAFNRLQSVGAQHGASDWAWERILESKRQPDIEHATRMLEIAARDLEAGRAPNPRQSLGMVKRRLMPPPRRGIL